MAFSGCTYGVVSCTEVGTEENGGNSGGVDGPRGSKGAGEGSATFGSSRAGLGSGRGGFGGGAIEGGGARFSACSCGDGADRGAAKHRSRARVAPEPVPDDPRQCGEHAEHVKKGRHLKASRRSLPRGSNVKSSTDAYFPVFPLSVQPVLSVSGAALHSRGTARAGLPAPLASTNYTMEPMAERRGSLDGIFKQTLPRGGTDVVQAARSAIFIRCAGAVHVARDARISP